MKKRNILKSIKGLNANSKELRKYAIEKYVNKDGIAQIKIYLKNEELYDSFSNPLDPELNPAIFDYIEQEAYYIPVEYPLEIIVVSEDKNMDIQRIENLIKKHYWKRLADLDDDLHKNKYISLSLLVLGIILYALYFTFEVALPDKTLFNEIFSVAATFLVWEAVDYWVLQRGQIKIDYLNTSQLASAKVYSQKLETVKK